MSVLPRVVWFFICALCALSPGAWPICLVAWIIGDTLLKLILG